MNKQRTLITLVMAVMVIVLAVVIYSQYLSPSYIFHSDQEQHISVQKPERLILKKEDDQKEINSLEIEFTGTGTGILDLVILDGENTVQVISLKAKKVDHVFKNDWYSDSCVVEIHPRDGANCDLDLVYRFLSTK